MFRELFRCEPPWLVGIVNITPDSFSDGGEFLDPRAAVLKAQELRSAGAHLIELGAQSSAPGSQMLSAKEELARLLPVLEELDASMPVSIDTYRASVADECLRRGARMINDISGLRFDPELAAAVASHGAKIVIMHSKESALLPHASDSEKRYADVVAEVSAFLLKQAEFAQSCGIPTDHIVLDPGIGRFLSHDPAVSWELIGRYDQLCNLVAPYPVMVATSRKGFLGGNLSDRDIPSQLSALIAVHKGAQFIRTHHVEMARSLMAACQ